MEKINDIVSSIVLGGFLLGIIILLVILLRRSIRENRLFDEANGLKKPEIPNKEKELKCSHWSF